MNVTLISHSTNPLESICIAIANMTTKNPIEYVKDLDYSSKCKMVEEIFKSKLQGPLEFADFHFHLEGVTRSFTHQIVRHRTFSFSQQSLRFFNASQSGFRMPSIIPAGEEILRNNVEYTMRTYQALINLGVPTEDARSVLPHGILTLISFRCTYRGLVDLAGVRLCAQAQGEFKEVVCNIKEEVAKIEPYLASKLLPICKHTGYCEFKSSYDRPCPEGKHSA